MKFGIIGTNFVVNEFMKGVHCVENCTVQVVCDIDENKAKAFQAKYNISKHTTDYKTLIHDDIDAIYIATPNVMHYEMADYFLDHKIAVFCEKPLASNICEVQKLVEKARKLQVYLQEGLVPLFNPNFDLLKEKLHLVGNIHQVNINMSQYSSRYDAYLRNENPPTFQKELSNGAMMDLGVYTVGCCIGLFGKPNQLTSISNLLPNQVDVAGSIILGYESFNANIAFSKASTTYNQFEICGENGTLIVNHVTLPTKITFFDRKNKTEESFGMAIEPYFKYEIEEMMKCIASSKIETAKVSGDFSIYLHEVLTACRKKGGIIFPCDE